MIMTDHMQSEYLPIDTEPAINRLYSYTSRAEILLFDGNHDGVLATVRKTAQALVRDEYRVGILCTDEEADLFSDCGARVIAVGSRMDIPQVCRVIYRALRALDDQNMDKILMYGLRTDGVGIVLWDWMLQVASGRVQQDS